MQKSEAQVQMIAPMLGVEFRGEVFFDAELIMLEGRYSDELCAHRARRGWTKIFMSSFLLEREHDFELSVVACQEDECYALRCSFVSACGRYAFWRLTHGQAIEAQYQLEVAHVPEAKSNTLQLAVAPDLRPASFVGSSESNQARSRSKDVMPGVGRWLAHRSAAVRGFMSRIRR
jgi:hypothetical protein